jgi:RNA polymerase sigma-70 factor, ECF subfamily
MVSGAALPDFSRLAVGTRARDADGTLVAACREGDERAFAALYHRHVAWVWGRLTTLLGPVAEREDLVQQVFLEVHRAIPAFRGDAAFTTFLFRIVAHVAYQHLRRTRRRPPAFGDGALDELVAPGVSPEAALRERQELERTFGMLARIKPKKRIALLLRTVEGLALEEIASIVGARLSAVAHRVRHAQRELAALVEGRR